jgi:ABC-2 type transport system ATP-binding protein
MIDIANVTKLYGPKVAVQDVTLQVPAGELFAFLGPNGAGKTTTLKLLSGVLTPSGGSASVMGFVPWKRENAYRRRFALVMGQKNQLWWDLPANESLELNAQIYGIPRPALERRVGIAGRRVGVILSGGNVDLARVSGWYQDAGS